MGDRTIFRLEDLLEITSSKRIHAADYVVNGIPFYRGKEIIEKGKGNNVTTELFISIEQFCKIKQKFGSPKSSEILLTSVGTIGVPYYIHNDGDFYFKDGNLTWFRNFSAQLNPKFLFYWLISPLTQQKLEEISIGSTQKALTISALKSLEISLPTIQIQREIVSIIDSISERIALLRESNGTLESIAQALFKSWFIDFDPVHAKAEGREPERMDAETAAFFPDSFVESELGVIPKGWRVGILDDIAKTVGGQKQTKDFNSDVNYVGLEHMPRNSLGLFEWSTAEGLASAKSRFALGDILFGKLRPYFHKVVIAPFDGVCSTDILVCQSKKISFYGVVLMHFFSNSLINYASRLSNGAKMPRINWKDLAKYPIILPPEQVAKSYSISIQPLLERMKENTQQAKVLGTLRDILLPRLISGQIMLV